MAKLLKVLVQPVFVVEDDEHVDELVGQVITVPGRKWREFADTAFSAEDLEQVGKPAVRNES